MEYDAYKEHQRQYNKVYYEKNKEKILARIKANQDSDDWRKKRKEYRKKYYEMNRK